VHHLLLLLQKVHPAALLPHHAVLLTPALHEHALQKHMQALITKFVQLGQQSNMLVVT